MIEEISANDGGEEVLEHFAGIEEQLKPNPPLGLPAWNPREVLELERCHEPELKYGDELPSGPHGHIRRILACTILLRNAAHVDGSVYLSEEDVFVETSAVTLLQLTCSAIALRGEVLHVAVRFLLWVYDSQSHPTFRPFAAFAVLLLTALITTEKPSSVNLGDVCAWVLSVEAQCREQLGGRVESERWLIGLNGYEDRERHRDRWTDSAKSVLEGASETHLSETREILRNLSGRSWSDDGSRNAA